ncbi:sugar nucleotide-binding protein [Phreatobacter sp. HK31-P]
MKALIIGAESLIGATLAQRLAAAGHEVFRTSRRGSAGTISFDLALTPQSQTLPAVDTAYILAGITSQAACEADPDLSRTVNVSHTIALAEALAAAGSRIAIVSTNLVLGDSRPLAPADSPYDPQGLYAAQKAEVESALLRLGDRAVILRITKLAETLTPLLSRWRDSLLAGETIEAFTDLVCAPLPLNTVTTALQRMGERGLVGILQIGATPDISYADIATLLASEIGARPEQVEPIDSRSRGIVLASRPRHTTLDTRRTEAVLDLPAQDASTVVQRLIRSLV